jgi:glutaredoxin
VRQDASKMDQMLKISKGQRKVPVIVKGREVTIGFGGGS